MDRNGSGVKAAKTLAIDDTSEVVSIHFSPPGIKEDRHDTESTNCWALYAVDRQFSSKQSMRDLGKDPSAVACSIGRLGAPMLETDQALHRQLGETVRRAQIARSYEADATGVVLETRVVERSAPTS